MIAGPRRLQQLVHAGGVDHDGVRGRRTRWLRRSDLRGPSSYRPPGTVSIRSCGRHGGASAPLRRSWWLCASMTRPGSGCAEVFEEANQAYEAVGL